jgi:MFS family permease
MARVTAAEVPADPVRFVHIYFAFAGGYLLSYLFRSVNAVIAPDLTRDLALTPGSLGLLTGAYFVAFAALQLPLGMLLDRYGPRRIEPVLLTLGGLGALAFATADDVPGLVAARALIGAGAAACLMAPLKAIATWYPVHRQASLSGWIMVAGGFGALLATTPLEIAVRASSWRMVFVGLAIATFVAAAVIFWRVPDVPRHPNAVGLAAQWRGVRAVFAHPRLWWLVPVGGAGIGTFFAIQGLWSVPWLIEVNGYTRSEAARHLLVVGIAMLGGFFGLGMFATRLAARGIHARHLFAAGYAINFLALAAIIAKLPGTYLWWPLYGLGAVVNVLAFPVLNDGLPSELAGRSNTATNLLMFGCSFVAQWGIGVTVDVARASLGYDTAAGLRLAFGVCLAIYALAFLWFFYGWKRYARPRKAAA